MAEGSIAGLGRVASSRGYGKVSKTSGTDREGTPRETRLAFLACGLLEFLDEQRSGRQRPFQVGVVVEPIQTGVAVLDDDVADGRVAPANEQAEAGGAEAQ